MLHMAAAALLVAFCDHHAARQLHTLLLQRLESQHGGIGGVPVISTSSPVEFSVDNFGVGGSYALHPTLEGRLLVVVSVEEESVGNVALYLGEDQWSVALILDDLDRQPLDVETKHPVLDVIGCSFQFAIGVPLRVEGPG